MISQELRDWIMNDLPNSEESWWSDGYIKFIENGNWLAENGISEGHIKVIFEELYGAVASEFGN